MKKKLNALLKIQKQVCKDDTYNLLVSVKADLDEMNKSSYEQWRAVLEMKDPNNAHMLFENLWKKMEFCRHDPALASLQIPSELQYKIDLSEFFVLMERKPELQVCFRTKLLIIIDVCEKNLIMILVKLILNYYHTYFNFAINKM